MYENFVSRRMSSCKIHCFRLFLVIFSPYFQVTLSNLCTEICSASSGTATITWSSANRSDLMSLFLKFIFSLYLLFFPLCNNLIYIFIRVCVCVCGFFFFFLSWWKWAGSLSKSVINFYRLCQCGISYLYFVVFTYCYNCCK
jgi:hypothetical protein